MLNWERCEFLVSIALLDKEACMDFKNWLDLDMLVKLLMHLKDPSDLAHVSSMSRSCTSAQ